MDNNEKSIFDNVKKFVSDNRVAIAIGVATTVTAVACVAIQRSAIKDWNSFLAQEGLIEKFYNPQI